MNKHTEQLVSFNVHSPVQTETWKIHTMDETDSGQKIVVPRDVVTVDGNNMDIGCLLTAIGAFMANKTL
jgi:hypothetical protein